MLTNVQVLAGTTSVARFSDVVVWFETGPEGGGTLLPQLLAAVKDVASGDVAPRHMGARLATVLNDGDATTVPALAAATPEDAGLRVVVHGWGCVVADGIHIPSGWADQVIHDRSAFFLGRNTATPLAPVEGSVLDLEEGVVPGDGASFTLAGADDPAAAAAPGGAPAASPDLPSAAPVAAAPPMAAEPTFPAEPPAYEPPPSDPPAGVPTTPSAAGLPDVPAPAAAPLPPGRLVLDDGRSAVLERTCVVGSAPHGSPAVQTGVALPLTVTGPGVAAIHVEIRVETDNVAARDLGSAPTDLLPPGGTTWERLTPGRISPLAPGSRIAIGQRTISYERP